VCLEEKQVLLETNNSDFMTVSLSSAAYLSKICSSANECVKELAVHYWIDFNNSFQLRMAAYSQESQKF
jgi:hypothetical protein